MIKQQGFNTNLERQSELERKLAELSIRQNDVLVLAMLRQWQLNRDKPLEYFMFELISAMAVRNNYLVKDLIDAKDRALPSNVLFGK